MRIIRPPQYSAMPDDAGSGRYDRALNDDPNSNLTVDEVRVLWSFIHGDIMDSGTRARLVADWGFCARHAWAYAVTEIELWESGAGARGGHQPFDVSILYADLLDTMLGTLTGHHRERGLLRVVAGSGQCLVCDEVRGGHPTGFVVTHAGFNPEKLTVEANGMMFTRAWFTATAHLWSARVCPVCAGTDATSTTASLCRLHLLGEPHALSSASSTLMDSLGQLRTRLLALTSSMTQNGEPATADVDASWVETLGWFHGWSFPVSLTPAPW